MGKIGSQAKFKDYKDTDAYRNWKLIIKGAAQFPSDAFFAEITDSHNARKSRTLSFKAIKAISLIKASAQDVNLRSRCVELMVKAKRIQNSVSVANEAFRDYLISQGMVEGRTVSDRKSAAATYIKKGVEVESDLDNFVEVMNDFITDIDQTGWSLKRMMDGLIMASKPENTL